MQLEIFLPGAIGIKKNSKQIVRNGRGKPYIISSANYLIWERWAVMEIQKQRFNRVTALPMFTNCDIAIGISPWDKRKRDIENVCSGILDALVKAKVLLDDNWNVVKSINAFLITGEPGARIILTEREEGK